jgi:hypothetical protein
MTNHNEKYQAPQSAIRIAGFHAPNSTAKPELVTTFSAIADVEPDTVIVDGVPP